MEIEIPKSYLKFFKDSSSIIKYPNTILREVCAIVGDHDHSVQNIIKIMINNMNKSEGKGIAACQVGVLKRIIIFTTQQRRFILINPEIINSDGTFLSEEGCLSIPGLFGIVSRPSNITIKGTTPHWKPIELSFQNEDAAVVAHELDHLDGILFIDKLYNNEFIWK